MLTGADHAVRSLGGALAWARQQSVSELHVLVDEAEAAAVVARRAALFDGAATVWRVVDRSLVAASPSPPPTFNVPPPIAELFRPLLKAAGTDVVTEQGELLAEVRGLEVARVVCDGDDARLEVGVGRFDREAFALMNANVPDGDALAKAVATVGGHRRPDALRHPLNQLVPERWLRSDLLGDPARVGAVSLEPVESAVPRRNLTEAAPATALGLDRDGRPVVVTCSSGVDLDLVPTAADDRQAHAPGARLVLALPERDVLAVTEALAEALVEQAEIVAVADSWHGPA
ncbi:MAG: hypothetical protein WKF43_07225 [Acidimicrobiales bacterium]